MKIIKPQHKQLESHEAWKGRFESAKRYLYFVTSGLPEDLIRSIYEPLMSLRADARRTNTLAPPRNPLKRASEEPAEESSQSQGLVGRAKKRKG